MQIILFDPADRRRFSPLTDTRAVAALRTGILTARERWERMTGMSVHVYTCNYLQALYPHFSEGISLWIDATVLPSRELVDRVLSLGEGDAIADSDGFIAARGSFQNAREMEQGRLNTVQHPRIRRWTYPWQLFQWNAEILRTDFDLLTRGRTSAPLSTTNRLSGTHAVFLEEGAVVEHATLNTSEGPIYIGKNALVMEGALLRGPFAMGEGSVIKMGARIYGATTLGPYCTVGGEIKNSILTGYTNKAHDGYLGDSVIGEWCNFGAGTSNSNVKNTAGEIMFTDIESKKTVSAGQKCGMIMGDYSRTAINSSISTGSVIGVGCHLFGQGLLPKHLPNFSWGIQERYQLEKAIQHIEQWMQMKNVSFTAQQRAVLHHLYTEDPA